MAGEVRFYYTAVKWTEFYQLNIQWNEPLNKGHIGIKSTVPCRESVLISEVNLH